LASMAAMRDEVIACIIGNFTHEHL